MASPAFLLLVTQTSESFLTPLFFSYSVVYPVSISFCFHLRNIQKQSHLLPHPWSLPPPSLPPLDTCNSLQRRGLPVTSNYYTSEALQSALDTEATVILTKHESRHVLSPARPLSWFSVSDPKPKSSQWPTKPYMICTLPQDLSDLISNHCPSHLLCSSHTGLLAVPQTASGSLHLRFSLPRNFFLWMSLWFAPSLHSDLGSNVTFLMKPLKQHPSSAGSPEPGGTSRTVWFHFSPNQTSPMLYS